MKPLFCLLILCSTFQCFTQTLCDTIYLQSSRKIAVQHIEMKATVITYEKCGQDDDHYFVIPKSQVLYIKYSDIPPVDLWRRDSSLIFNAKVYTHNSKRAKTGYLYQFRDSSLLLSKRKDGPFADRFIKEFEVPDIKLLEIGSRNRIQRSLWIGTVVGFVSGVVTGVIIMDQNKRNTSSSPTVIDIAVPDEAPIYVFGTIGTGIGAAFGVLTGAAKIRIPIKGKQDAYKKAQKRLNSFD